MFKFNFDVDDSEDSDVGISAASMAANASAPNPGQEVVEDSSKEVFLSDLLSALPTTISFSPLAIPLSSKKKFLLARRDLFDARFQLIAMDEDSAQARTQDGRSNVHFVDAPSDLVPGVYEGGLKTWECSLDLIDCLNSIYGLDVATSLKGKRIMELGCGTAVPSLYLLHSIFSVDPGTADDIHIHLQDYNTLVLQLVTLPNIILAWYMSPAASAYRSSAPVPADSDQAEDMDVDAVSLPPADVTQPGELSITPALTGAFLESLKTYGIGLRFFSGAWSTFGVEQAGGPYDIMLTSETIYRTESLSSLVALMKRATAVRGGAGGLEDAAGKLSLSDGDDLARLAAAPYLCLVAAKLVYFGVGGGVSEFVDAVENPESASENGASTRGSVRTIWERNWGVKRRVMQVVWETL